MEIQTLTERQLDQAVRQVARLQAEREHWIRVTVCLAKAITEKSAVAVVDGNVAVKKSDFEAVPHKWAVNLADGQLKDSDAPEDAPPEPMIVVVVKPAEKKNGKVLAPERPRLVLP